jgi:hypothetical protein
VAALLFVLLLAQPPGRPLFYWGARPATIVTGVAPGEGIAAQITEVHGVVDDGELVLRVSFDRPVAESLYLPSGAPVSGRLRGAVYVDADADRSTGWAAAPGDPRGGADYRIDLGVLALGADPGEGIAAQALVTVSAFALTPDGHQRSLWRADHSASPGRVSIRGDAVEVRLPGDVVIVQPTARLGLVMDARGLEGTLAP